MITLPKNERDISRVVAVIKELTDTLQWLLPGLNNESCGKVEPPATIRVDGFLAYANGVDWNPNTEGEGYYRWNTGTSTWVKLG